MNLKELIDIYFKLNNRFDFLWNFYTFFIIAIGSYFISNKMELMFTFSEKVILIAGYLFFISMNIAGLVITSGSLKAVAEVIHYMATHPSDAAIVRNLVRKNHGLDNIVTFLIHGIMLSLFITLVMTWQHR
jgi:hypothetical protein